MSYDIYLDHERCPTCGVAQEIPFAWNYTSNVAPMWRKAMPATAGLAGLHGWRARDAAKALRDGIARMEASPDEYEALNPENGWGSFGSQLEKLRSLLDGFEANPDARVSISR